MCTISCVHQISYFDFFRGEQTIESAPLDDTGSNHLVTIKSAGA